MMTSGALSRSRICCKVSRPSIPGSQTSRRTRSKPALRNSSRQRSPLSATAALYPSSSSTPLRDCRIPASSSTMRMLCMQLCICPRNRLGCDGQLHHKLRAYGSVFFDADRAAMIFNDSADYREPEPGSSLLGGEVRQEEAFL